MAERRMFAKTIIDSDAFLELPMSTQLLYFHLSMRADDDGFINSPKKIQRMIGCTNDDSKELIKKKFIISFESGIVVIKHWFIHNYIGKDRYHTTKYKDERAKLKFDENKSYTSCIQDVDKLSTQVRLGKVRLGKVSNIVGETPNNTFKEVIDYLNLKTGKHFKYTETNKKLINTRLKENYTLDDFKKVIDNKVIEWLKDEKMSKYLQPSTLFSNKFDGYLNQEPIKNVPEWFEKEIKNVKATKEEVVEMKELLKDFK